MLSQVTKHIAPVVLNFPVWPADGAGASGVAPETTLQSLGVAADDAPELAELQTPPAFWAETS
jgi:hypothetical protein